MENVQNVGIEHYKEVEAILTKILSEEGYPKPESSTMDSIESNNIFMRGYMTGFNELYGLTKELRRVLAIATGVIQTAGCNSSCIHCTKNTTTHGKWDCDGVFEWDYKKYAAKLIGLE